MHMHGVAAGLADYSKFLLQMNQHACMHLYDLDKAKWIQGLVKVRRAYISRHLAKFICKLKIVHHAAVTILLVTSHCLIILRYTGEYGSHNNIIMPSSLDGCMHAPVCTT